MKVNEVIRDSCNRVVINEEGEAVTLEIAKEEHNIIPTVIFWRNDGWSLGAPEEFESIAFKMWKDHWVRYARSPQFIPENMNIYNV